MLPSVDELMLCDNGTEADVLAEASWPGGPPTPETVQQARGQLVDWGNLQSQPDTARVATIEDFYRKRLLYRMTSGGEAVEAGLQRSLP
jgi:hypothetical protein